MRRALAAAVLALAFLSTGDAGAETSETARPGCPLLWVTAPAAGRGAPAPRLGRPLRFSAAEVLDLEFRVVIPAEATLARRLQLKLFTPKGHLYQTLEVPTASGTSGKEASRRRRPRYRTVSARLPVAGTTIVNNSLYGTWRAEASFDGEPAACAKARTFVIKP